MDVLSGPSPGFLAGFVQRHTRTILLASRGWLLPARVTTMAEAGVLPSPETSFTLASQLPRELCSLYVVPSNQWLFKTRG